jgi:hypothetical protein
LLIRCGRRDARSKAVEAFDGGELRGGVENRGTASVAVERPFLRYEPEGVVRRSPIALTT